MSRIVVLPKDIERRLDTLAILDRETNGALLYRQRDDYCVVESLFMTGDGTERHVQSEPRRVEVVNGFLRAYPDYKYVEFHTHTRETIRKHGEYYAKHFSREDRKVIREQLRHDREFIAMLVTPETKLLSGVDNPSLVVDERYLDRSRYINIILRKIAEGKGYKLNRLETVAVRK